MLLAIHYYSSHATAVQGMCSGDCSTGSVFLFQCILVVISGSTMKIPELAFLLPSLHVNYKKTSPQGGCEHSWKI